MVALKFLLGQLKEWAALIMNTAIIFPTSKKGSKPDVMTKEYKIGGVFIFDHRVYTVEMKNYGFWFL